MDQAVVGLFLAPAALGLYVSAAAFTNLPKFVAQSIGMVAYPKIAAEPDDRRRRAVMRRFTLVAAGVCSAAVVALLIIVVSRLLPFFFGHEFDGAVGVARVLLVGGLFIGMRRVLSDGARGIGRPGAGTMAEVVSWVVLIPALAIALQYGILGVAWALTGAAATSVAALLVMLYVPRGATSSRRRRRGRRSTSSRRLQLAVAVLAAILVGAAATHFPDSRC